MANSIDEIIENCVERHGLEVTDNNKEMYEEFLKRQLLAHPEYDLNQQAPNPGKRIFPYLNLMGNKLMLFSYLDAETSIIAGYKGNTKIKKVESIDDWYLLRPAELGAGALPQGGTPSRKTDITFFSLYISVMQEHTKYGFPSWGELIDELGFDSELNSHFKGLISYDKVLNSHSPTPITQDFRR
jgi:hypothetical protein